MSPSNNCYCGVLSSSAVDEWLFADAAFGIVFCSSAGVRSPLGLFAAVSWAFGASAGSSGAAVMFDGSGGRVTSGALVTGGVGEESGDIADGAFNAATGPVGASAFPQPVATTAAATVAVAGDAGRSRAMLTGGLIGLLLVLAVVVALSRRQGRRRHAARGAALAAAGPAESGVAADTAEIWTAAGAAMTVPGYGDTLDVDVAGHDATQVVDLEPAAADPAPHVVADAPDAPPDAPLDDSSFPSPDPAIGPPDGP